MMSTPPMIGCDLTTLPQRQIDLLSNRELIRISQDAVCLQAFATRDFCRDGKPQWEIWVKGLRLSAQPIYLGFADIKIMRQ